MMPIPDSQLRDGSPEKCHVQGWNQACVFRHVHTNQNGLHTLLAVKSKKKFQTANNLLYTTKHSSHPQSHIPKSDAGTVEGKPAKASISANYLCKIDCFPASSGIGSHP